MQNLEQERAAKQYGRPNVGGPFTLATPTGEPFTEKDLLGRWSLVYFGFTNCPDICPAELDKMTEVMNVVGKLQQWHHTHAVPLIAFLRERARFYIPTSLHLR